MLFNDTLRYNLDPFSEHDDSAIAHALDVALTRDCASGGDIAVHLVTADGVRTLEYARRTD